MQYSHLILIGSLLAGCVSHPRGGGTGAGASSALAVSDYDGAAGYGRRVEYDGHTIRIVATSDFAGEKDKVIWTKPLSVAERAFLDERIEKVPLASLKDEYRNPNVWDGLQISFEVRKNAQAGRSISVANEYVEELAVLCGGLNAVLPHKYRIRYQEWKDATDREAREAADGAAG